MRRHNYRPWPDVVDWISIGAFVLMVLAFVGIGKGAIVVWQWITS